MINKNQGFTFIEILIYLAIVSVFLVTAVHFTLDIIFSKAKSQSMREVQQNSRFVISRITQEIKAASDINLEQSVFDSHPGVLSLQMAEAEKNPTVFDTSDGILRITQVTSSPDNLTTNQVEIANLIFTNLGPVAGRKNIGINLTIQFKNPERKEFNASSTVKTAITLRNSKF